MTALTPEVLQERERVTEAETTELIRKATRERFLDLGFGPSGAWLQPGKQNDWAREELRKMRCAQLPLEGGNG